ncbi:MAG: (Fe-S)-binding protein [Bacteroidales bacterium]|nr:(Fe-S)-binding protein [Bacteroidales bacterium]
MKVALFIPCYVDALSPDVGTASWKLLRHLGVDVSYPENQTCCGQPMANGGFERKAIPLARKFEERFKGYDYVVTPSVSCPAFIKEHYPHLLGESHTCEAAEHTVDIVTFLHDILKVHEPLGRFPYRVSLHNSCHGVRVLGLSAPSEKNIQPYNKMADLLSLVEGIEVVEPERKDECCGFGGFFSMEERAVSKRMGTDKLRRHINTGAQYVTGPDASCLMHLKGIARGMGADIKFKHIVEILSAGL